MAESRKLPSARYAIEFAVIFLGVWLGLMAENYREYRQERADEQVSLQRLIDDLGHDVSDINGNLQRTEASHQAARWILARADRLDVPRDSLAHYLTRLQFTSLFIPNTSEYSALKGAGRINIIENEDLRQGLTQLYESYPYVNELHSNDTQQLIFALDQIAPDVRLGIVDETWFPPVRVISDPSRILSEPRFLRATAMMIHLRNLLEDQYRQKLSEIDRLQELAREQLDR